MSDTVLVVEDEANIRDVCRRYLERDGYRVLLAADGEEGWATFAKQTPDLVVLDLMLPRLDGWELCERIRQQSDVPIIMLTARTEERDRLMGLTIGADDYLVKPFSPRELALRVGIILRRVKRGGAEGETAGKAETGLLEFTGLTIDPQTRRIWVQGEAVELTLKEFEVLHVMAKRPGQVFSRMQLLDLVWESEHSGDANAVTVLVSRLREKVEPNPTNPRYIHTVWGIGYRFEVHEESGR
ncbi:response regulator transcription factor [Tumebacillus flagellatus]|uniref:PhoP family transcriptional regulator n=1 Tax=Tumebacillus flagellatus TaxID=1157490 RepID=A0A074LQW5_9BACL|nr:response regulator transcription factor [Tumebacillus flagellatus]KEO82885.1 PhoP family transcriptional regulator [Tumebacillus flagellatus]